MASDHEPTYADCECLACTPGKNCLDGAERCCEHGTCGERPTCPSCGDGLSDATGDSHALGWDYDCETCERLYAAEDVVRERADVPAAPLPGETETAADQGIGESGSEPPRPSGCPPIEEWSDILPPGGSVCGWCGDPVESEPCNDHCHEAMAAKLHALMAWLVEVGYPFDFHTTPAIPELFNLRWDLAKQWQKCNNEDGERLSVWHDMVVEAIHGDD